MTPSEKEYRTGMIMVVLGSLILFYIAPWFLISFVLIFAGFKTMYGIKKRR